jgi:hypothetical protein
MRVQLQLSHVDCQLPCAGVVSRALFYKDVNVSSALPSGKQVRVCNPAWSSFAAFDKVAFIQGSVLASSEIEETQAHGLLQVLKAVDAAITPSLALRDYLHCQKLKLMVRPDVVVTTPSGKTILWGLNCSTSADMPRKSANV